MNTRWHVMSTYTSPPNSTSPIRQQCGTAVGWQAVVVCLILQLCSWGFIQCCCLLFPGVRVRRLCEVTAKRKQEDTVGKSAHCTLSSDCTVQLHDNVKKQISSLLNHDHMSQFHQIIFILFSRLGIFGILKISRLLHFVSCSYKNSSHLAH